MVINWSSRLLPFFLELAALEVARVLVWGSGVAGGMAPVDHRNLLPVAAY